MKEAEARMKRVVSGVFVAAAVLLGSTTVVSIQDDPAQVSAREAAAREAAGIRAQELRNEREQKARAEWIDRQRKESEANLNMMAGRAADTKARENELKYANLNQHADDLVALSQKIQKQVQTSGAQSVSVGLFSDLDRVEATLKLIRKYAK
jgi:hypothetical protein